MTRVHDHYTETSLWIGKFSGTVAASLRTIDHDPKQAKKDLRELLASFIVSGVPDEKHREILRRCIK